MKDSRGARTLPASTRALLFAGSGALRALASTWRYRIVGESNFRGLTESQTPFLFSLWHGQLLPLLWHHRNQGVSVLVSEHQDGEVIARVLAGLGYGLVRGSTSRGAGRALLGLVRRLRQGGNVAITPDGPRGPLHRFAPGAAVAAYRAGAPILPICAHAERCWRMSSWDGFMIPKPFARITVAYGVPTFVEATDIREAAAQVPLLEQRMREAGELACR